MDLPLFKNDITTIVRSQKPVIYSRYMKSGLSAYMLEVSGILTLEITCACGEVNERKRKNR